jgi:hypothetical protein
VKLLKTLVFVAVILALAVGAFYGAAHVIYNRQFNALKRELSRHNYPIIGQWRHEDITLEDFGFTVKTPAGECRIDIRDGTEVRVPSDQIEGIAIRYPDEIELRAFLLNSDYWRHLSLPKIEHVSDLVKHLPQVLEALRSSPPVISHPRGGGHNANHKRYLFLTIPKPPGKELTASYKSF